MHAEGLEKIEGPYPPYLRIRTILVGSGLSLPKCGRSSRQCGEVLTCYAPHPPTIDAEPAAFEPRSPRVGPNQQVGRADCHENRPSIHCNITGGPYGRKQ